MGCLEASKCGFSVVRYNVKFVDEIQCRDWEAQGFVVPLLHGLKDLGCSLADLKQRHKYISQYIKKFTLAT